MGIQKLVGLILCNLVWSANPTMGKLMLRELSPVMAAWFRYSSALLAYVVGIIILRMLFRAAGSGAPERLRRPFLLPANVGDRVLVVLIGFMTFFFSPLTQFSGLAGSRATENSLIIAMEPLFTVLLAWLVLRERMTRLQIAAFLTAILGFTLLADLPNAVSTAGWDPHFMSNLILLVSLAGEALYSVLGRKLMARHPAVPTFGSALAAGVGFLSLAAVGLQLSPGSPSQAFHLSGDTWLAIFWLGPLGTTITYLYWMEVLTTAPVATMALTLFIQPVLGALWGYSILKETLTVSQCFGGLLILAAVSTSTLFAGAGRLISMQVARKWLGI